MGISDFVSGVVHAVFPKTTPYTSAVILAGGVGSRMMSPDGKTKQLREICGVPVIIHTLRAFDACPHIRETVLVVREEEKNELSRLILLHGIQKVSVMVTGGKTRKDSALQGFLAISKKAKFVAIHDAARCLIRSDDITRVVVAAHAYRAATAASPVVDTVKTVTEDGFIEKTLPRDGLVYAATPQVFQTDLYRAAVYTAEKDGLDVTDDNMLLEHIGQTVKVVDCGFENFKITSESDLYRAEIILRKRENGNAT